MIKFTETVLRDANQSLVATRLPFASFEPILNTIDRAGYYSAEVWGGATFDVCLRFLGEDPWERLRKIRKAMPNTKLQMLLRGRNLLGYTPYSEDVVRRFVRASVRNGIDIIRIFDALNDTENLKVAMDEGLKCGAEVQGAISYTTSPVHTDEAYVRLAEEFAAMGAGSICIKDMSGILMPETAYKLVTAIKSAVDLPVAVHTHCTTGLAFMTCMRAAQAGADRIDTAISPFSGGTSQPATETLYYALKEMGMDGGLDEKALLDISNFFKPIRAEFLEKGTLNPISLATDTQCLTYQIPGGMLSNLLSQLKSLNALDKFEEALLETPRVRKDMGYPPLVTPTSQIVGSQAVLNVLAGERYKNVSSETRAYCKGAYGRTPAPIDPAVKELVLAGDSSELIPPDPKAYEKAEKHLEGIARSEEDVLSYIAFPSVAERFFEERKAKEEKICSYSIERID